MLRTHHCGELRRTHDGADVSLCGWVDTRRDHGGLLFIDLRDRWGKTQLVFNPSTQKDIHAVADKVRPEYVLSIRGKVAPRPAGTENPKLATGDIEIHVTSLDILNSSATPPFEISDDSEAAEEIRLRHRYLDIRRKPVFDRLRKRYHLTRVIRDYLDRNQFIEIETPYLTKSTPEGARDYLVPARLSPGTFYALPQSPQIFKQILMVASVDRYFQLARCFRDEDLRADRQPEHTQVDIEMSFVNEEDIYRLIEGMFSAIFKQVLDAELKIPFERLSYEDAMNRFGTDKPDLRYELELHDVSGIFAETQLKVFQQVLSAGGVVKGFRVSGKVFTRKELDELTDFAKTCGAKGLVWVKVKNAQDALLETPIAKFLLLAETRQLVQDFQAGDGDTLFLVCDQWENTCLVLGELRKRLARDLRLTKQSEFRFLWVVDFPLLEWSSEEKRWQARHHPFTSPKESDLVFLEREPGKAKARAYDLVLNGTEIGGGSIRIHTGDCQRKMFQILGISKTDAEDKFGFLLKALQYGAPPHGGIALGLDRMIAMLLGAESIRDVIAFPKTQKGACLMSDAPSAVTEKQLKELHLRIKT